MKNQTKTYDAEKPKIQADKIFIDIPLVDQNVLNRYSVLTDFQKSTRFINGSPFLENDNFPHEFPYSEHNSSF